MELPETKGGSTVCTSTRTSQPYTNDSARIVNSTPASHSATCGGSEASAHDTSDAVTCYAWRSDANYSSSTPCSRARQRVQSGGGRKVAPQMPFLGHKRRRCIVRCIYTPAPKKL